MTTKTFGQPLKKEEDYIDEVRALVDGLQFPLFVRTSASGELAEVQYETEWLEGGTTAVEKTDDEGNTFIDYEENYTTKKLTAAQIKTIDKWATENIQS